MKFFTLILIVFSSLVSTANAQVYYEGFYLESKNNGRFLIPTARSRNANPRIVLSRTSISMKIGETILVPIFSELTDETPLPIRWIVENDSESGVSAIIDEARPISRNRETWAQQGPLPFSRTLNIGGPSVDKPVENATGCERRFYDSAKLTFINGIVRRKHFDNFQTGIYLCLHAKQVGKVQIAVGESVLENEFDYVDPRISTLLTRKAYLSASARALLTVEVKDGPQSTESKLELGFVTVKHSAQCKLGLICNFKAILHNRAGEILPCDPDKIKIDWGVSSRYKAKILTNCALEIIPKFVPFKGSVFNPSDYILRVIANQTTKTEFTNPFTNKLIAVEKTRQAQSHIFIHPVHPQKTENVYWGSLRCPSVVAPGEVFRCQALFSANDGNHPTPTQPSNLTVASWDYPNFVQFTKIASNTESYYCFRIMDAAPDDETFIISGTNSPNGLNLSSRKVSISKELSKFIRKHAKGC